GELARGAELEEPLVAVVTGAAAAVEPVLPLVPVVTGAVVAVGAAGGAGADAAGGRPDPAGGFPTLAGLWWTLWIVLWTTWVRTFGCFVSAEVAAGGALFELSAYPARPPSPRIVALAAIRVLMLCGRPAVGWGIGTASLLPSGSPALF